MHWAIFATLIAIYGLGVILMNQKVRRPNTREVDWGTFFDGIEDDIEIHNMLPQYQTEKVNWKKEGF